LRNVVERLTVLSDSEIISFNDVIKFSNKK
jgi:hypothetical protein